MAHYSNWITPRSVVRPAKRFDAHFFITVLDKQDVFGDKDSLNTPLMGQRLIAASPDSSRDHVRRNHRSDSLSSRHSST